MSIINKICRFSSVRGKSLVNKGQGYNPHENTQNEDKITN